jgi:hypothetical protein
MKTIKKITSMKKILILSFAAVLGFFACTERPEEITDPVYARLLSPTKVEAVVENMTNVTLTWSKVENAESYNVELYKTATPETIEQSAPEIEETTCTFNDLDGDVEYGARVQANSAKVPQSKFAVITFETVAPPPPEITWWNFSDEEFAGITEADFKQTETVRGLDVVGGTGGVQRTASSKTIDEYDFTYRLDLRGGGSWNSNLAAANRVIHFMAEKPCVVTVYANSTAGRTLKITDKNDNVLGSYITTGSIGKVDVNVKEKTDIYIYSGGSGIEVYAVKMVVGGTPVPLDPTTTLAGLGVKTPGGATYSLTPAFAAEVPDYEATVPKSATEIEFTYTRGHPGQTVAGAGKQAFTAESTVYTITVTADDGENPKIYSVNVKRD